MSSRARTAPPTAFLNFRVAHGRYYGRIFPAELMCKWLGYGTQNEKSAADNLLCGREFSFTIAQDVYIRYLSFENADALRKVRPNPTPTRRRRPLSCRAASTAMHFARRACVRSCRTRST